MILYETLNQPTILLYLIIFGFLSGLFFDFANIISFLCNKNKVITNILLFFSTIFSFFTLFVLNSKINYGQFRFYIFAIFFLFLFIERITLGKCIAKTQTWCYNTFEKFIKALKQKNGKRKNKKEL